MHLTNFDNFPLLTEGGEMNRSSRFMPILILLSFCFFLFNCESNSTDPKENIIPDVPAEVIGDWEAIQYILSNNANPTDIVDLISEGFNLYLTIQSNGSYTSTFTFPGVPDETETGTAVFTNNTVTINPPDEDPFTMAYQVTDSTLAFVNANSSFDFDDDGTDEPATETIVLVKL